MSSIWYSGNELKAVHEVSLNRNRCGWIWIWKHLIWIKNKMPRHSQIWLCDKNGSLALCRSLDMRSPQFETVNFWFGVCLRVCAFICTCHNMSRRLFFVYSCRVIFFIIIYFTVKRIVDRLTAICKRSFVCCNERKSSILSGHLSDSWAICYLNCYCFYYHYQSERWI